MCVMNVSHECVSRCFVWKKCVSWVCVMNVFYNWVPWMCVMSASLDASCKLVSLPYISSHSLTSCSRTLCPLTTLVFSLSLTHEWPCAWVLFFSFPLSPSFSLPCFSLPCFSLFHTIFVCTLSHALSLTHFFSRTLSHTLSFTHTPTYSRSYCHTNTLTGSLTFFLSFSCLFNCLSLYTWRQRAICPWATQCTFAIACRTSQKKYGIYVHLRYTYVLARIYVCFCMCERACDCVCVHVCARMQVLVGVYVFIHIYLYMYEHIHPNQHLHTCTHMHVCLCMCLCLYTWRPS